MNSYEKSTSGFCSLLKLKTCSVFIILSVILFVSGCAGLRTLTSPVYDEKALKSANRIKNINQDIRSFSGIGWIYISGRGQRKKKFRIAFAAVFPDKIRLTLMISGFPVETIIADGRKIIFLSHTKKHRIYKIDSPNPSLERIISMPVSVQDIIALLAGRIPLKTFNHAFFLKKEKAMNTTLVLNKTWDGTIQKIISDSNGRVRKYTLLDNESHLIYSIRFDDFKISGQFKIPFRFKITDESGSNLALEITGYNANVPVKDSVFSLTESG